jgi:hypothetical protein
VSGANPGVPATPGSVLRRSLLIWGLGDLASGGRQVGLSLMFGEVAALAALAYLVIGLAQTTWYLVPFLGGVAFLLAWAAQAVGAYHRAQRRQGATGPTQPRSPAATVAWLSLPLLLWGTGFWVVGASGASPAAVLDRFEGRWPDLQRTQATPLAADLAANPAAVTAAAATALHALSALCRAGALSADCGEAPENLLRNVRITIRNQTPDTAQAIAETVRYERRASRFLGIFSGTELVPVAQTTVLVVDLRAVASPLPGGIDLGAQRWQIVNAQP